MSFSEELDFAFRLLMSLCGSDGTWIPQNLLAMVGNWILFTVLLQC